MHNACAPDTPPMPHRSGLLAMPRGDARTAEWRLTDDMRRGMESQLGPAASLEAIAAGEQALRDRYAIALLERKRADQGTISIAEAELLIRRENSLSRALRRFERLKPKPTRASAKAAREEHLARHYGDQPREAA